MTDPHGLTIYLYSDYRITLDFYSFFSFFKFLSKRLDYENHSIIC